MYSATHGEEVVLRIASDIDALAKVSKLIAERGINILAMSCWEQSGTTVIRLVDLEDPFDGASIRDRFA